MSELVFSEILVHLHHGNFLTFKTNFLTFLHLFSDISTHGSMFWHFVTFTLNFTSSMSEKLSENGCKNVKKLVLNVRKFPWCKWTKISENTFSDIFTLFYRQFSFIFLHWSSNFRSFFHFGQVIFLQFFTSHAINFLTFLPTSRILL